MSAARTSLVRLVPPPLHRLLYRLAYRARRRWLSLTRRTVRGCSILARDGEGRFLLVRHSYGPKVWTFPGGGIRRGEAPVDAALRELREELGCGLVEVRALGTLQGRYLGGTNVSHVFTGIVSGEPRPDRREIVEARFFARDAFPGALGRAVAPRLRAFDAAQVRDEGDSGKAP